MVHSDFFRLVIEAFSELRVPYFVTGSVATSLYGEPRDTMDVDIVADLREEHVPALCARFASPEYYLSEDAARQAIRHKSQFNILQSDTGLKADIMVPEMNAFNRSRFKRAREWPTSKNVRAFYTSPEDAIIKKMDFFREGGSEKHLRDIAGILKISPEDVDKEYVTRWARDMDLTDIWELVQSEVAKSEKKPGE